MRTYVRILEEAAMIIKHTPDAYEKLTLLGSMAGDDILSLLHIEEVTNRKRKENPNGVSIRIVRAL